MAPEVNFVTTNPAQLNDRVSELQIATQLDEANYHAVVEYTTAGAITQLGGTALLKTGTAGAMTLANPIAGSQLNGGQDGAILTIVPLDGHAYTVTVTSGFNGGSDLVATAITPFIGDQLKLLAFGGGWFVLTNALVADATWAFTT